MPRVRSQLRQNVIYKKDLKLQQSYSRISSLFTNLDPRGLFYLLMHRFIDQQLNKLLFGMLPNFFRQTAMRRLAFVVLVILSIRLGT